MISPLKYCPQTSITSSRTTKLKYLLKPAVETQTPTYSCRNPKLAAHTLFQWLGFYGGVGIMCIRHLVALTDKSVRVSAVFRVSLNLGIWHL